MNVFREHFVEITIEPLIAQLQDKICIKDGFIPQILLTSMSRLLMHTLLLINYQMRIYTISIRQIATIAN